jgi:hypothetical protein
MQITSTTNAKRSRKVNDLQKPWIKASGEGLAAGAAAGASRGFQFAGDRRGDHRFRPACRCKLGRFQPQLVTRQFHQVARLHAMPPPPR